MERDWHKYREFVADALSEDAVRGLLGSYANVGRREGVVGQTVRDRFKAGKLELAYLQWLTLQYPELRLEIENGLIKTVVKSTEKIHGNPCVPGPTGEVEPTE